MSDNLNKQDYNHLYFNEKAPSVGTPLKGVQIKILTKNKNIIDKENTIGEILVKGPNVIKEYLKISLTKSKFLKKYLKTGDIGYYKYYKKKKIFLYYGKE